MEKACKQVQGEFPVRGGRGLTLCGAIPALPPGTLELPRPRPLGLPGSQVPRGIFRTPRRWDLG